MEIIHIVLGLANPTTISGVNRVVQELSAQQAIAGEKVSLWRLNRSVEPDSLAGVCPTRVFLRNKNPFSLPRSLRDALDEKRSGTVFHLHGGFIPILIVLALELFRRNIPYIFSPHGSYNTLALSRNKWLKRLYFAQFEKRLLEHALAIHCIGRSEMAGLERIYPNRKAVLIPYGFDAVAQIEDNAHQGEIILGFCGRMDSHSKGLDVLMDAFAILRPDVPGLELWMIGDGKDRQDLEDLASDLGIDKQVFFFGNQCGQDRMDLLSRVMAFIHPSRNEGLPTSVLEAASLGIPCVVTETTNVGDAVRQFGCGEVIGRPEPVELSAAIKRLLGRIDAGGLERMRENAHRMVREHFCWAEILPHFHALYETA